MFVIVISSKMTFLSTILNLLLVLTLTVPLCTIGLASINELAQKASATLIILLVGEACFKMLLSKYLQKLTGHNIIPSVNYGFQVAQTRELDTCRIILMVFWYRL